MQVLKAAGMNENQKGIVQKNGRTSMEDSKQNSGFVGLAFKPGTDGYGVRLRLWFEVVNLRKKPAHKAISLLPQQATFQYYPELTT